MAKIANPSGHDVKLPTGHIVPGKGTLTTTNAVLRCPDNAPFLSGQVLSGALTVAYDPASPTAAATAPVVPSSAASLSSPASAEGASKKG